MTTLGISVLLDKNSFIGNYTVKLHEENKKAVARLYEGDLELGKCTLQGLSLGSWAYETLPENARSKIDQLLKDHDIQIGSKKVISQDPSNIALASLASSTDQKAKQTLSEKHKQSPEKLSGDSEEELSDSDEDLVIFQKQEPIKAKSMTISGKNETGEIKNIKGSTLIEIVHEKIQDFYEGGIDLACEYEKDIGGTIISAPKLEKGIITIDAPKDWVMSLGGWKGMMPSE